MADERSVQAHYRAVGLLDRIVAGLREAGKDPDAPTVDDLAPADEFHSAGRAATKDLAALAALKPGTRVLDVGSGLAARQDSSPRRTGVTSPVLTLCLSFAPWPTSCPA